MLFDAVERNEELGDGFGVGVLSAGSLVSEHSSGKGRVACVAKPLL